MQTENQTFGKNYFRYGPKIVVSSFLILILIIVFLLGGLINGIKIKN